MGFEESVAGIGALDDEVRRELYLYVSAQPEPVGRDQAADALGIPRHRAKFHLDRLEDSGLLQADYTRLTGRSGPGAGRPAKVYCRAAGEIAVSLPGRDYALAGELMARAIAGAAATGRPVEELLHEAARERGRELATTTDGRPLEVAVEALANHGYEPRVEGGRAVMVNCPFHALAQAHTELVCGMNHALVGGLCERLGELDATLEPAEDRCCVVVSEAPTPPARSR